MAEIKQFVGFSLAKENYGIDIMSVEEIISVTDITPVPRAPSFIIGIINMRGSVIPIVDLRIKLSLGLKEKDAPASSRVIVTSFGGKRVGFVVDYVDEVLRINVDTIDSAPGTSRAIDSYISGVAKTGKGMVIILDIAKIFSRQEKAELAKI